MLTPNGCLNIKQFIAALYSACTLNELKQVFIAVEEGMAWQGGTSLSVSKKQHRQPFS
jgi:hypothetical protein